MRRILLLLFIILFASMPAHSSRLRNITSEAKETCGKNLSKKQAIKLIKKVFLTCRSGGKVDIGGCSIKCMKKSSGAVVGESN